MRYILNNSRMKKASITIRQALLFALLGITMAMGCKRGDGENAYMAKTTIEIEDPVRHYYPVLQGQKQNITVKVTNTGTEALKIYKVLPSCGCTIATYPKNAIAPGSFGLIEMEYNSIKNIGKVAVYSTLIANTEKHHHTIYFDLNVVPDALYTKDYEELYHIEQQEKGGLQELVEGEANERGYITDSIEVHKYM